MLEKIKEYTERAYATACKHGFHDEELSEQHLLMLVITEVSEMVEADRKGRYGIDEKAFALLSQPFKDTFELYVKDSVPDEMADVCIRLFDLLGVLNKEERIEFDLLKVIVTNQKKVIGYDYMSFTERAFALCNILTSRSSVERVICRALAFVVKWAQDMKIEFDLLKVIVTNQKKVIGYDYMSFTERAFALCNILTSRSSVERVICRALAFVVKWAQDMKIDLDWHIEKKMQYNELRENKHGKKY